MTFFSRTLLAYLKRINEPLHKIYIFIPHRTLLLPTTLETFDSLSQLMRRTPQFGNSAGICADRGLAYVI
jgi:hypothetical protein